MVCGLSWWFVGCRGGWWWMVVASLVQSLTVNIDLERRLGCTVSPPGSKRLGGVKKLTWLDMPTMAYGEESKKSPANFL